MLRGTARTWTDSRGQLGICSDGNVFLQAHLSSSDSFSQLEGDLSEPDGGDVSKRRLSEGEPRSFVANFTGLAAPAQKGELGLPARTRP